jgi:hypothetical protein
MYHSYPFLRRLQGKVTGNFITLEERFRPKRKLGLQSAMVVFYGWIS